MITVSITVRNPIAPDDSTRVENVSFASEWVCRLMCQRYMTCIDVEAVIAVNDMTEEVIFDSNDEF